MGDRVVVMRDGRIEQVGNYDEIYYKPVNLYVAAFFSEPPLCPLQARLTAGRDAVLVGERRLQLPDGQKAALAGYGHDDLILGCRADSLALAPEGDGTLPFEIERYEEIPSLRAVYAFGVFYGKHAAVHVEQPGVKGLVHVRPNWENLMLFAAGTEEALYHPPARIKEFSL
jgi:ABC-type sugar transport system ATPase subunit